MTDERTTRLAEFRRLFAALPGPRNVDRIRQVCTAAGVAEGTVRQWCMSTPPRAPSEQVLRLLRA
jgi:hypothetical protein